MNAARQEFEDINRIDPDAPQVEPLFKPQDFRFGRFLESDPPVRKELIKGWLPAEIVGLTAGTGGSGKSMVLYQMGISVTSGCEFLGMRVSEVGGALLLMAEDDEGEIHRRGRRALDHAEGLGWVDRAAVADRLHVVSRVGEDNRLTAAGPTGDVARTRMVDRLIAAARMVADLKLIGIDTVSRFAGGKANAEEDRSAFVVALESIQKATGATVIATVHTNKQSLRDGDEAADQAAVRGSSALVDGVRWCATMQKLRRDKAREYGIPTDDAGRYVRLDLPKSNYTAPWGGLWLRREAGGVLVPCELVRKSEELGRARFDAKYDGVLAALHDVLREHGPMTRNRVEKEFAGASGALGAGLQTVRSVVSRAVGEGTLGEIDDPAGRGGRLLTLPKLTS